MILIILTIIYFIIKLCNQKIETFDIISGIIETKTGIPMPNIENDANVSISSSLITDKGSNIYITENIIETLEINEGFKEDKTIAKEMQTKIKMTIVIINKIKEIETIF